MAKKIAIGIIHGIGKNGPGFAAQLIKGVEKAFRRELKVITAQADDGTPKLHFEEIVWDDVLSGHEEKLKGILERSLAGKKSKTFLSWMVGLGAAPLIVLYFFSRFLFKAPLIMCFLLLLSGYFLYRFGPRLYYQLRTGFAALFVMDVIGYLNQEAYDKIHARIKDKLKSLIGVSPGEPVTFLSHSLGTVIASDFVYDRHKQNDLPGFSVGNFFTMGSPLTLFALRFGAQLFNKPIGMDVPYGRWVNILDKDDPIAYPLKGINAAYDAAVLKDQAVKVGALGIAHVRYWGNAEVHAIIAAKLALDWLKLNNRISDEEFQRRLTSFDQNLGLHWLS